VFLGLYPTSCTRDLQDLLFYGVSHGPDVLKDVVCYTTFGTWHLDCRRNTANETSPFLKMAKPPVKLACEVLFFYTHSSHRQFLLRCQQDENVGVKNSSDQRIQSSLYCARIKAMANMNVAENTADSVTSTN